MVRMPITYNGTNTDNLFVSGWKNGKPVKLRVKSLSCHGGIIVDSIVQNTEEYTTAEELKNTNKENLSDGTIYHVEEGGKQVRYLFYDNSLIPLDNFNEPTVAGMSYGTSYKTYEELYTNRENLADNTVYSVTDKGTLEQYLFKNNVLTQIGNGINEITEGNEENLDEVSTTPYVEGGIIEYNMPELVNGDYRYKNHTELHTVISDMPSLVSGIQVFMGTSLQGFCGDLSSLEEGRGMFGKGCRLDVGSIVNIIDSIPNYSNTDKIHHITISYGMDVSDDIITEMTAEAQDKNWEVEWIAYNN